MAPDNRLQVRVSSDLIDWLNDRAQRFMSSFGSRDSQHEQARTELELWREVLAVELRRIPLTVAEASCLADVLNGSLISGPAVALSIGLVAAAVEDAFRLTREDDPTGGAVSSYGAKHGIDEELLLGKLRRLGPAADHALADAIARWWAQPDPDATAEGFRAVGLRINEQVRSNAT